GKLEQRHGDLLREIQQNQAALRELGRQQGSVRGRIQATRRSLTQIEEDLQKSGGQIEESRARAAQLLEELSTLEAEAAAVGEESDGELQGEIESLQATVGEAEQVRRQGREKLDQFRHLVNEARRNLDSIRARISHDELEIRKVELEDGSVRQR